MGYGKLVVGLIGIVSSLNVAYAERPHDESLIAFAAIDENYQYVDIERASLFFDIITNITNSSLPLENDDGVITTGFKASPYGTVFSYKLNNVESYNKEERQAFKAQINSKESIRNLCDGIFMNKYQRANDTKVLANYSDRFGNKIGSIELNTSKC